MDRAPHPAEPDEPAPSGALALDPAADERRDERRLRIGVALFAGALLVALVASIQLSTLGVSFGSLVYGTVPLWRGQGAVFRVASFDPHSGRLVPGLGAVVRLRDHTGVLAEVEAAPPEGLADAPPELAEARVMVPPTLGPYPELEVELHNDLGSDRVRFPIRVGDTPGAMSLRVSPHTDAWAEGAEARRPSPEGPWQIALYPRGGTVVAGFENHLTGRLTHHGQPAVTRVRSAALGLDATTDALGLFEVRYRPPMDQKPLAFEIDAPADSGDGVSQTLRVPLQAQPVQMLLAISPGPIVRPGQTLSIRLDTLPLRTPVHIDVWIGDALVHGSTGVPEKGARTLEVQVPDEARGFLRVEAYKRLWAPEGNLAAAVLWVSPGDPVTAAGEALAAAAQLEGSDPALAAALVAEGEERLRLTELVLSRLVPTTPGMPSLRDNLQERQAEVERRVTRLRGRVHGFLAATLLMGAALGGAWIVRHQLRVAGNVRSVMEEGIARGEDAIDPERVRKLTRLGHAYELGLVAAAMVLLAYGLWMLLTHMAWTYPT